MEQLFQLTIQTPTKAISLQTTNPDDVINMMKLSGQSVVSHEVVAISAPTEIGSSDEESCSTCGMTTCECGQTMEEEYENTPDATRERGPRSHGEITDFGAPGQGHSKHGYRGTAASGDNPLTFENITTDYSSFKKKISLIEGLEPEQRSRLDSLISDYEDATDPSDYNSYYDPEEIIDTIRQEFGDKIASQVEDGSDKMHFPRQGHSTRYDPLSWKKPVDRITKAGKMYKQDSDYLKNTIKSRYKLSGKSATEGVAEGIGDTIKRGVKSVKRGIQGWGQLNDIPDDDPRLLPGAKDTPRQLVARNKRYDDKTVTQLARPVKSSFPFGGDDTTSPHSPRGLQKRVLDREMKKRGLDEQGVAESMGGQVVFSGTGANGGKYEVIQKSPDEYMIHANGKHIDTYSSLQRAMSVLKNEVPGLTKGVAEGLENPTRKVFLKVIKTQGTGMPSGYRRVETMTPLEDGGFYIELSTPGYGMDYTKHNYKNFSLKDGQGKPITGQEAYDIINGQQGDTEGPSGDLVYISVDRVEDFEDSMDSEGLETNVPKTDEGTYVVYDYSKADHISKMYASEWNEKQGVAEGLTYAQKHSSWVVQSPKKSEFNKPYKLDQEKEARAHAERIGGKVVKVDQHGHAIKATHGMAEGNDYFKRRKDEEDRIAGTKPPAKRTPQQTDYAKRRAQEKKTNQGVAEANLDPSGLIAAASMVRDFIITAETDGQTKKYRIRGMTGPRAAKERFLKHHSMAKVLDVKPEQAVAEAMNQGHYKKGDKVNYEGARATVKGLTRNQDGEEMAFLDWDQKPGPKLNPQWGPDTVPVHWLNPDNSAARNFPKGLNQQGVAEGAMAKPWSPSDMAAGATRPTSRPSTSSAAARPTSSWQRPSTLASRPLTPRPELGSGGISRAAGMTSRMNQSKPSDPATDEMITKLSNLRNAMVKANASAPGLHSPEYVQQQIKLAMRGQPYDNMGLSEEASPMIKPPTNRFDNKQTKYAIKHKETGEVLSSHDDEQSARDEHKGLGTDQDQYKLVKTTKTPKTFSLDEDIVMEGLSDIVKGVKRSIKGKEHPDVVAAKHLGSAMGHYNQGDIKAGNKEEKRYIKTRDMHLKAKGVTEAAQGHTIEAHGIRGMSRKPWRKTFKDSDALSDWCEKYDAECYGQRELDDVKPNFSKKTKMTK